MRFFQVAICYYGAYRDPKVLTWKSLWRLGKFSIFQEKIFLGQTLIWGNKDFPAAQAERTLWPSCFLDVHSFHWKINAQCKQLETKAWLLTSHSVLRRHFTPVEGKDYFCWFLLSSCCSLHFDPCDDPGSLLATGAQLWGNTEDCCWKGRLGHVYVVQLHLNCLEYKLTFPCCVEYVWDNLRKQEDNWILSASLVYCYAKKALNERKGGTGSYLCSYFFVIGCGVFFQDLCSELWSVIQAKLKIKVASGRLLLKLLLARLFCKTAPSVASWLLCTL